MRCRFQRRIRARSSSVRRSRGPTTSTQPSSIVRGASDLLQQLVSALAEHRSKLDAVLEGQAAICRLLEHRRQRPLSRTDRQLLAAIAAHVVNVAFTAGELWHHAEVVTGELREAIAACGLTNANALGRRLRSMSRHGGTGLASIGRDEGGVIWIMRLTSADAVASGRQDGQ
jgi:hypothetical protein